MKEYIYGTGSFVKAKLLTGIQAPEDRPVPVLLQADYAFIGPNKSHVDLSGCFLIGKSTGNLSIERVEMQTQKISCVAKSGKMFKRKINGFVTDGKDNSFAVAGSSSSNSSRATASSSSSNSSRATAAGQQQQGSRAKKELLLTGVVPSKREDIEELTSKFGPDFFAK